MALPPMDRDFGFCLPSVPGLTLDLFGAVVTALTVFSVRSSERSPVASLISSVVILKSFVFSDIGAFVPSAKSSFKFFFASTSGIPEDSVLWTQYGQFSHMITVVASSMLLSLFASGLTFSDFASFVTLLAPINASVNNNRTPEYLILVLD